MHAILRNSELVFRKMRVANVLNKGGTQEDFQKIIPTSKNGSRMTPGPLGANLGLTRPAEIQPSQREAPEIGPLSSKRTSDKSGKSSGASARRTPRTPQAPQRPDPSAVQTREAGPSALPAREAEKTTKGLENYIFLKI